MPRPAHLFALALTLPLAACAGWTVEDRDAGLGPESAAPADLGEHVTYTLQVSGMTCPFTCVRHVREQLSAVPGVLHVQIDWEGRRAIVDVAPATDPDTLVRGLKEPYAGRLL